MLLLLLHVSGCSLIDDSADHADLGQTPDLGPSDGAVPDANTCQPSPTITSNSLVPCGYVGGLPYYTFWDGCNSCTCLATEDGGVGRGGCTLGVCPPDGGPPLTPECDVSYPIPAGRGYGSLYCDPQGRLFDLACAHLAADADGGVIACVIGRTDLCGIDADGPYVGFYAPRVCQACICPTNPGGDASVSALCTGDFLPGCSGPDGGPVDAGIDDGGVAVDAPFCMTPGSGRLEAGQTLDGYFCDARGKLRLVACMSP